jgi:hypothetical protein
MLRFVYKSKIYIKKKKSRIVAKVKEIKETENLRSSVYDLRPEGKA